MTPGKIELVCLDLRHLVHGHVRLYLDGERGGEIPGVLELRDDLLPVQLEKLDETIDRLGEILYVFRDDVEVEGRAGITDNLSVPVEYGAPRRDDLLDSHTVLLGQPLASPRLLESEDRRGA